LEPCRRAPNPNPNPNPNLNPSGAQLDPSLTSQLQDLITACADSWASTLDVASPDSGLTSHPVTPRVTPEVTSANNGGGTLDKQLWLEVLADIQLTDGQMAELLQQRSQLLEALGRTVAERAALAERLLHCLPAPMMGECVVLVDGCCGWVCGVAGCDATYFLLCMTERVKRAICVPSPNPTQPNCTVLPEHPTPPPRFTAVAAASAPLALAVAAQVGYVDGVARRSLALRDALKALEVSGVGSGAGALVI